jgi:HTH-type transcriptional repressor of NAD biosynthesis genes
VKKIAIVGTESTGKTTLCKRLAEYYHTTWVQEVGRELVPDTRQCTLEDLKLVATEHAKSIVRQTRVANKVLFLDTDVNITKSYANFLFGEVPKVEPWVEKANQADYYIYLERDAPYVDDGTRMEKEKRDELDKSHKEMLRSTKEVLHVFSWNGQESQYCTTPEEKYENRFRNIVYHLNQFLNKF